jgi:hypothetical protein
MDADKITNIFLIQLAKFSKAIILAILSIILISTLVYQWIQTHEASNQINDQFSWLLDVMAPKQKIQAQAALALLKKAYIQNKVNIAEWHQIGYILAEIKHDGQLTDLELDSLIQIIESTCQD